jgi:hypothetical protein
MQTKATLEELRDAFERSTLGRTMLFYDACTDPLTRQVLELGISILRAERARPPLRHYAEPAASRYATEDAE